MARPGVIAALAAGLVAVAAAVIAIVAIGGGGGAGDRMAPNRDGALTVRGDAYRYLAYVPPGLAAPAPLVVVLHGCQEPASVIAAASDFDRVAAARRFSVLYPEVDTTDTLNDGCWKGIWEPGADGAGRGDAAAIAAMVAALRARVPVDPGRIYAIGISAGAFETAVLGAAYPHLFAAIGLHSGATFGGAQPGCRVEGEPALNAAALAHEVVRAMGTAARPMPVIVIHGLEDPVIPYRCGTLALAQWLDANRLIAARAHRSAAARTRASLVRARVPGGHEYTVTSYRDALGCTVAQLWSVAGMGHTWSGGSRDAAVAQYSDPAGPSAAAAAMDFFAAWRLTAAGPVCVRR